MRDLRLRAVEVASEYGPVDGEHHKMWVIDQMLRVLIPDEYEEQFGSDQNWDEGAPP